MRYLTISTILGTIGLGAIGAAVFAQQTSGGREARVAAIFAAYNKPTSPGCTVAVYQGDRIAHKAAFGMANLDHDVPLTPSSVFHVASVSKQFTGTAILLLAGDGKLSLDDDIRKHLPELPDFGKRITIRQLANHTSGIRDQWDLLNLAGWRYSRDLITDDDVMELLTRQKALNFEPGERHLYSNSGYTLMALIVSRVSGKSLREFTTERIFKPLGMNNTFFRDNFSEIVKHQAYGYAPAGQGYRLSVTNFDTAGATSLLTTVEDLLKWHMNFDARHVGGDALQSRLLERGVLNGGTRLDYAFGVTHGRYRGVATVGHGGSDAGYRANFVRFPEHRLGVATLCNIATANPGALSHRVADVFLPESVPPAPTSPRVEDSPEVPIPQDALKKYAGLYWNAAEFSARRTVLENGRLHAADGRGRIPLKSLGEGVFVMTGGSRARITFEDAPGGEVRVRIGNDPRPLVKTEPFMPTAEQMSEFAGVYRSDEMDAVFRIGVRDGALRAERTKIRPWTLEPLVKDVFRGGSGVFQFTREGNGRLSGFLYQGGRIKNVKFWKEGSPARSSTNAQ
jgi:CubicO group peptidase (beta-lactamase class C family)